MKEILNLVEKHESWRGRECLNLIPSENIMSETARKLLSSELAHRYTSKDQFYMGTRFTDEIEQYGERLAKELFKAETADLRPLSGHIADMIVLASIAKPEDTLLCVAPEDGGYPGMWQNGLAELFNLKTVPMPFSKDNWNIKIEEAKEIIETAKPKIVLFGASLITFTHPVKELARVAKKNDAFVGFDGSHVMGLIAGEQFQDPLREGAYVLFGSTHKSLFGPQGGIILADRKHGELFKRRIYPAFVDNAHWNRIAALSISLAEMKRFGKIYARQVVQNAQTLAKVLHDYGFPVMCASLGFTRSHQVLLDYGSYEKNRDVAARLEKMNIICDCAIRFGTCEITRRGMKEREMLRIAELVKRAILDKERPHSVKRDVAKLIGEFQGIEYCFAS